MSLKVKYCIHLLVLGSLGVPHLWSHSMSPSTVNRSIVGKKVMQRFQISNMENYPIRFHMKAVARDREGVLENIVFMPKDVLVQAKNKRSFSALVDLGEEKKLEGFICSYSGVAEDSMFQVEGVPNKKTGSTSIRTGACNAFRLNRIGHKITKAASDENADIQEASTQAKHLPVLEGTAANKESNAEPQVSEETI